MQSFFNLSESHVIQHPYYVGLLWDQIHEYLITIFDPTSYSLITEPRIEQMVATLNTILPETGQDTIDPEEMPPDLFV